MISTHAHTHAHTRARTHTNTRANTHSHQHTRTKACARWHAVCLLVSLGLASSGLPAAHCSACLRACVACSPLCISAPACVRASLRAGQEAIRRLYAKSGVRGFYTGYLRYSMRAKRAL